MCCELNMNMQHDRYYLSSSYQQWFSERLAGENIANIRFHLNDHDIAPFFRSDFYDRTARLFRNFYSRRLIRCVRHGAPPAAMVIYLHSGSGRLDLEGRHFHILAEYPENRTIEDVEDIVREFCVKPRCVGDTQKYVQIAKGNYYVEETHDVRASLSYNSRFGNSTLLLSS